VFPSSTGPLSASPFLFLALAVFPAFSRVWVLVELEPELVVLELVVLELVVLELVVLELVVLELAELALALVELAELALALALALVELEPHLSRPLSASSAPPVPSSPSEPVLNVLWMDRIYPLQCHSFGISTEDLMIRTL
jgi:hypothetical protein